MLNSFNPLEKKIARLLSSFPLLKVYIKRFYSLFMFLLNYKSYKFKSDYELISISDGVNDSFFGYYDKSPDNGDGLVLFCTTSDKTNRSPRFTEYIYLDVFDIKTGNSVLNEPLMIKAFNWQQGSRCHWLDKSHFIYNDYDSLSDSYISKVFSLKSMADIQAIELPVQDSFKDEFFLSLCYKALSEIRPDYGYFKHSSARESDYSKIGIWKYDLKTNKSVLLLSINDIINYKFDFAEGNFTHKVNHIMISPCGNLFMFMHRYYDDDGKRYDRLILSDSNGNLKNILSDHGMVSHCAWVGSDSIIGYLRGKDGEDRFWFIRLSDLTFFPLNGTLFDGFSDGHPTVFKDNIVFDTYPDKSRMQSLYFTKLNANSYVKLGEFYHGFNFEGESRCDLHPRFSSCGKYLFFDTVYSGKRQLCYLSLNDKGCK